MLVIGSSIVGLAIIAGDPLRLLLLMIALVAAHVWLWRNPAPPGGHSARASIVEQPISTATRPLRASVAWVQAALEARLSRGERRTCMAAAAIWFIALFPMFQRLTHDVATGFLANDWLPHLRLAGLLEWWPPRIPLPTFLFHLCTRIVLLLVPGIGLGTAAALVGAGAAAFAGATVTWFLFRPLTSGGPRLAPGAALAGSLWILFSELPQVLVFRAQALRFDRLNVSLHQWGTPTNVMVDALQLLWFVSVAVTFSQRPPTRAHRAAVVVLGVLAALALPALTLAVPIGLVLWLAREGRLRERLRDVLMLVWLPLIIAIAAELAIYWTWLPPDRDGGIRISLLGPIANLPLLAPGLGVFTALIIWIVAGRSDLRGNREFALAGWSLLVALAALLLILETGSRAAEGNVGRVAFSVATIAYMYLIRWAIGLAARWREFDTWPIREKVAAPLLMAYAAICLAGGVALYLEQVGLITFTGVSV